jgi:hypothetical protein
MLRFRTGRLSCGSLDTRYTNKLEFERQARWRALLNMQRKLGDLQHECEAANLFFLPFTYSFDIRLLVLAQRTHFKTHLH